MTSVLGRSNGWFLRVLLVQLLMSAAMHGMRPMVSYRALALDAGPVELGFISAGYALLSLLIVVPAGRWVDRVGEPRFMVAGAAIVAVVAVWLVTSADLLVLGVGMSLLGAGQIVAAAAMQTLVANGGAPAGRDTRFGTHTVVASLGQLVGPAAAGILVAAAMGPTATASGRVPLEATDGVFVAGALAGVLACLVGLSLWRWPPRMHVRRTAGETIDAALPLPRAVSSILRVPSIPQAMLASVAVLTCVDVLAVYLPLFGQANAIPVATVGLLLAVRGGAAMASRALMLPLRRLFGRRRLLVGSMLVPAAMLCALPLAGSSHGVLFVAVALIGFGLGLGQPLTISWVATRAPVAVRGTAIAVRLSANRLGQLVVPTAAGLVAGVAGLSVTFWVLGAGLLVSSALVARTSFDADAATDTPDLATA